MYVWITSGSILAALVLGIFGLTMLGGERRGIGLRLFQTALGLSVLAFGVLLFAAFSSGKTESVMTPDPQPASDTNPAEMTDATDRAAEPTDLGGGTAEQKGEAGKENLGE